MAKENAKYYVGNPVQNDGKVPHYLTVKDVPVDAFWSITVYRADGYLESNGRNVYAYHDRTAKPNSDDSFTIYFGDCISEKEDCLNIPK